MVHPFLSASTIKEGGIDLDQGHQVRRAHLAHRGDFAVVAFADAAVVNAVAAAAAVAAGRTIVVSYPFGRGQFEGAGIAVRLS